MDSRRRPHYSIWLALGVVAIAAALVISLRPNREHRGSSAEATDQAMPGMSEASDRSDSAGATPPDSASSPASPAPEAAPGGPGAGGTSTIFVPPERQQSIGVKLAEAQEQEVSRVVRTVARVAVDERGTTHIHTKVAGWIEDVFVNFVGQPVERGQPLFTIYSPDLVASQEEYLLALRAQKELGTSSFERVAEGGNILAEAARRRLLLWDMTPQQIAELERAGEVSRTVTIHSPVSGVVQERAAYHHGRYVTPDLDLYTIVDLSRMWLLAQVYESELPFIRVGQRAEVEFPYGSGQAPPAGRVTFIAPFINPETRAAEVRMEFANISGALRPDAFYNVALKISLGRQLVVPTEAVMETGEHQYVFVDVGEGYFEPRQVDAGAEADSLRVIERGLEAGERVVTAANFLIDAESRLRGAFAGMGKPSAPRAEKPAGGGGLNVEVTTEPTPAKVGRNRVRVKVIDASGEAVRDAEVQVTLFMPQMGAMPPMETKANLFPAGPGEYTGEIEVLMAWTWEATVTVRKGGQTLGVARINIVAR